jgi:hypothetical protein
MKGKSDEEEQEKENHGKLFLFGILGLSSNPAEQKVCHVHNIV